MVQYVTSSMYGDEADDKTDASVSSQNGSDSQSVLNEKIETPESDLKRENVVNLADESVPEEQLLKESSPVIDQKNAHKDTLRKGKWTVEEELYTNKVIEVFNAGLLKLEEKDRGITLRAYLAGKLECDPMRITKKYAGAACLGKKVYHTNHSKVDVAEAERARHELEVLEQQFKSKVDQMNRRRATDQSTSVEESYRISTPAIDALLQRNKISPPTVCPKPNFSVDGGFNPYHAGHMVHPFMVPRPPYFPPSMFYGPMVKDSSNNGEKRQGMALEPPPRMIQGPNGDWYFHQSAGYPPIMPPPYYYAFPPPCVRVEAKQGDIGGFCFPFPPRIGPSTIPNAPPSHEKDVMGRAVPACNGAFSKFEHVKADHDTENRKQLDRKNSIDIVDSDLLHKKPRLDDDDDQSEIASSFLGLINHMSKNGSQEDLVDFSEGVQKTCFNKPNSSYVSSAN